ncbi:hypothetical protein EJ02DRAFT_15771 [Clathrospora elynae]|uniref:Uncharacterized protein n=1 Tax=Clathrospora elynae TaxID=706981 RepID=A0A6A5SHB3_9PLEO|nr:hypothetical protein EJ02DRAFT_15771 [Clathrospora elynae]
MHNLVQLATRKWLENVDQLDRWKNSTSLTFTQFYLQDNTRTRRKATRCSHTKRRHWHTDKESLKE